MAYKVFLSEKADQTFWAKKLKQPNDLEISRLYSNRYFPILLKYLPKSGKILDAGCGWGALVILLREIGYDAVGVDFSYMLVEAAQRYMPGIPIKHGDIQKLEFQDGSLKAYVSLGVIEHIENGPQIALKEANRILEKGGILICSVPYFNPVRRIKISLMRKSNSIYSKKTGKLFYQYLFTQKEILNYISRADFKVISVIPIGLLTGAKDDLPFGRLFLNIYNLIKNKREKSKDYSKKENRKQNFIKDNSIQKITEKSEKEGIFEKVIYFFSIILGHMILIVAKKE